DLTRYPVESPDGQAHVHGAALGVRDHERHLLRWQCTPGVVRGSEDRRPLGGRHLAGLIEATAEDALRGLVVEDERARRVDQEDRHGEIGCELPRQDELDRLLGGGAGGHHPTDSRSSAGRPDGGDTTAPAVSRRRGRAYGDGEGGYLTRNCCSAT